jgi:Helix-turn-helix domain
MKRAAELFDLERRPTCSPFVVDYWKTHSAPEEAFISVAACHWQIVVTRQCGSAVVTVRGPETRATSVPIPPDAEFYGIQFTLGTFMPNLPPGRLVDRSVELPSVTDTKFWLDGSVWEVPQPHNVDVFIERLVDAGLLVHDAVASAASLGVANELSTRSLQRRVSRATGLTRGAIRQIRRAECALALLVQGDSTLDVVHEVGYADQAHLTRSLKRFMGQTPAQVTPVPAM